jgi:hypothetical protein
MDASSLTVENIAAMAGVAIVSAFIAARKYLSETRKTPAQESADLALLAGSIADMKPVREMAVDLKRLANAAERIADGVEARAEDDEVERRARARAAEIITSERGKSRS